MMKLTYSGVGVDVNTERKASSILYKYSRKTWDNRHGKIGEIVSPEDSFSGVRYMRIGKLPKHIVFGMCMDGTGRKPEAVERHGNYEDIIYDLFEMLAGDAVRYCAVPVWASVGLKVKTLGDEKANYLDFVRAIGRGYVKAAEAEEMAIATGEVAQMTTRLSGYGRFNFDLMGAGIWVADERRLLKGTEMECRNWLVALQENGLRVNGTSLFYEAMKKAHGDEWHNVNLGKKTLGQLASKPSTVYTLALIEMFGGYDREPKARITGVAHITGGGTVEKLTRMLEPSGLGAYVDDPFDPPNIMLHAQETGSISDEEAYRTWNMGQGMIVATPEPEKVMETAERYGIGAKVAGRIKSAQGISIKSKGRYKKEQFLHF